MAGKSKKQQTIAGMNDDKNEALKHALKAMRISLAQAPSCASAIRPSSRSRPFPTGSIALDRALGVGGLPKGRIIEIYGPESSGKTTVALHCVAEAQKRGGIAAFHRRRSTRSILSTRKTLASTRKIS